MLKEASYYARMAYYFQDYLRKPVLDDAEGLLRRNVECREENFLETLRTAVFGNARTPYAEMFRLAGCGAEDVEAAVRRHGLEKALEQLRVSGVYLTHGESKGTTPIVRHGREIPKGPQPYWNPATTGGLQGGSSGSRSAGTTGETSTAWRLYRETYEAVAREEFRLNEYREVSLMPILPAPWGVSYAATAARLGGAVEKWYAVGGRMRESAHYRGATALLVAEGKLFGTKMPFPQYLPPGEFMPVVEFLAGCARRGRPAFARGTVSAITRICAAAREAGRDIGGTLFFSGGEALTDGRRALIESAGCEVYSRYIAHETGPVGMACRHMKTGNTVHFFRDALAVIVHRRQAPLAEVAVDSLLFTTLNPIASRVYVNLEIDDAARIYETDCDCAFSRAGFTTALTDIHSFGKLTGFGMTLVGTAILPILEERLPARFGGSGADYQLVESAGAAQMELRLRIHPRLGADLGAVRAYFLSEIGRVYGGALSRRTWEHAETMRVVAAEPAATKTGKILPLHLAAFGETDGTE